jgi:glycosyltransferase involved in cell wall biosynthesis
MPVYNKEKRVKESILSIMNQDYLNTELIVVNDGSTDKSVREIKKAKKQLTKDQLSRFKFIDFDENKGACHARNAAIEAGRGDYFAFLPADAFLYPGVSRFWVASLDDQPEIDFVYGMYRFIERKEKFGQHIADDSKGVYPSKPFDPYLLETTNYIDGTFPVRKSMLEKMAKWNTEYYGEETGAWDHNVKSLQDWDFWLNAVKQHGAKGEHVPDVFFETDIPESTGLSGDSSRHWLKRLREIKEKHGIPMRKICVVSFGAQFHGINIAKMLDANFSTNPSFKPHEYELLYVVGAYPQFINEIYDTMRVALHPKAPMSPARKVLHWIGSDVMAMRELPRKHLELAREFFGKVFDEQLCECPHIQRELKDLGIKAKIVPLPSKTYDPMPLPEKPTVACYQPGGGMGELYMPGLMKEVAKKMPDVNFIFYGNPGARGKKKNIRYVPFVEGKQLDKLIKDSTTLVRLTIHDGLPLSIPEFVMAGRSVVTNVPLPHIDVVTGDFSLEGVIRAIKAALKKTASKAAMEYYRKLMDPKKFKRTIHRLAKYDPKGYWEDRAEDWDKQAEAYLSKAEVKRVVNEVKRLKAKSVIDIGCGNGQWIPHLPKDYHGTDISEGLIKICQEKWPKHTFEAVKLEDLQALRKYDVAFCHTVFLHIPEENMKKAIARLKEVAKKAIIIEPENVQTVNYQHGHDFEKWFDVEKKIPMKDRTLYVVNL